MRKGILLAALAGALLVPATASAGTYFSGTPVNFGEFPSNPNAPYSHQVTVSGEVGLIKNVEVFFNGFSSNTPSGAEALLVGPGGQKVILMRDACGGTAVEGVTFLFRDAAPTTLPNPCAGKSGIYKPTDSEPTSTMPAPAPAGPYQTSLAAFNGTSGNGTWTLFARDLLVGGDSPSLSGGWILQVDSAPIVVCAKKKKKKHRSAEAAKKKKRGCGPPKKKRK